MAAAVLSITGCSRPDPVLAGRPLSAWRASLGSRDAAERVRTCEALAAAGREAAPAIPDLVSRLADGEPAVGRAAAEALVAAGPDAIAPLERALDVHASPVGRLLAAGALARLVPGHDWATSVLVESLGALNDPPVAARAREVVAALGGALAPRVAALLDDPYVPLQVQALGTLGDMGERARPQLDRVLAALASPRPSVRVAAVRAAARIGPAERVREPLLRAAGDGDPAVAAAAGAALGDVRP